MTARGVTRQAIFRDDLDRRRYLNLLGRESRRVGWRCLTYCLMDNHVHLLLEVGQPDLSRGMQRLHGEHAQTFNRRYKQTGHLFERRFRTDPIRSDDHLWAAIAYIVNNPVAAGLTTTAEGWPWSSHVAVRDGVAQPWLNAERLFAYVGAGGGDPRQRYLDLVKGARPL